MLRTLTRAERTLAIDLGQIGAGTVVPFIPPPRQKWIRRPRTSYSIGQLATGEVCGDSLIGDRIHDGDNLTVKLNFRREEFEEGDLVLVLLPCGSRVFKHLHFKQPGKIILRASNSKYTDLEYELEDVQIEGLVIEHWRPLKYRR